MSDLRKTTGILRLGLKAAVRRALNIGGGGESIQYATRVKAPALSRYANPNHEDDHCPVDVATDLDLEAGQPIILAAMAEAQGYDIVKREPQSPSDMPWCAKMAKVAEAGASILMAIGEALADGKISAAEGRHIVQLIDTTIDFLRRLRERVQAEAGEGRS